MDDNIKSIKLLCTFKCYLKCIKLNLIIIFPAVFNEYLFLSIDIIRVHSVATYYLDNFI